jgi:mycoredoxin
MLEEQATNDATESTESTERGEIVMYSTAWCGDCQRARRVFAALGVPYRDVDVDTHPDAAERVRSLNGGMRSVPTILFPDGSVLVEPSSAALEAKVRSYLG